jgi:iron complex outermembrane receptor protein
MNTSRQFRRSRLATAVSTLVLPTLAATASAQSAKLEEVVVTATKRSASTQDIPVTVSAVSGEEAGPARRRQL